MPIRSVCIDEPIVSLADGGGLDWAVRLATKGMQARNCQNYGFDSRNGKTDSVLPTTDVSIRVID
jgi:hypothetical protein